MKPNICRYADLKKLLIINYTLLIALSSCSVSKQISHSAEKTLINDSVINTGHIGISIYEPATNKYWYNYDATKYFVPASNTKLFTLYAGMKYLGDSLVGLRYYDTKNNELLIKPTGDPTFLHPDFKNQPVYDFLHSSKENLYFIGTDWKDEHKGKGWSWDDYQESFMVERSLFPIYGNMIKIYFKNDTLTSLPYLSADIPISTSFPNRWQYPINKNLPHLHRDNLPKKFVVKRLSEFVNFWGIFPSDYEFTTTYIPGVINDYETINFLNDTIKSTIPATLNYLSGGDYWSKPLVIHSQPSDSLFKPMIHNSDNFFAEQTLLMTSNEHLGYMKDEDIIDTLLNTDLKDVPQKPKWVDGSGLSRYNLFTPKDFVYILNKMKNEFGLKRLEVILPTGNEGTLKNYYLKDSSFIYAKTGSMSNNSSLSGFIITKKNKLLLFSILVNNFQGSGTPVKKAVEQFLENIRKKY
jgi:D-alanyl-D-alanine carboxypeptidase/D-alanyl-D-alanine-endopeptidase (penicillin-binding protein 4)